MSLTLNRPKTLWSNPSAGSAKGGNQTIELDDTWAIKYNYSSKNSSRIYIKAGNKQYVLSGSTSSEEDDKRTVVSESSLYKRYK